MARTIRKSRSGFGTPNALLAIGLGVGESLGEEDNVRLAARIGGEIHLDLFEGAIR